MPVYNGAEYVGGAVGSLLSQTEKNFLLLISDDRSDDDTASICERLATQDSRIRLVRHQLHRGMIGNFNFVLRESNSPFFMWAAQDDLWAPEFLEVALDLLVRDPSAMGSMTAIEFIDPTGTHILTARLPIRMADGDPLRRARSVHAYGFHAIYALFRRELLLSTGVQLENVPAPDFAFVFGLALHGRFVTSERTLSTRRLIGYSLTLAPDGRVVWEKALGPEGRLYSWARGGLCRAMFDRVRLAPITPGRKTRLRGHILHVWWSGLYMNLVGQTGRLPIMDAWKRQRYVRAALLASAQAVLRPRSVYRAAQEFARGRPARS